MNRIVASVKGDIKLQIKYGFYTVYTIITVLYIIFLKQLPKDILSLVVPFIVFSDPSFIGFFFIGGLILLEKGENTLEYLIVTPMRVGEYLFSKMISLTMLATITGLVIALMTYGIKFDIVLFILGIVLTSFLFILIGFIAVAKFQTVNEYLMTAIVYITIFCIPIVDYFEIFNSWIFYLIPTKASLILIGGSFRTVQSWQIVYGVLYLILWIFLAYKAAYLSFNRYIISREGVRKI